MQKLTGQFVLATDEVWRLQGGRDAKVWRDRGGTDPECIAFQDMASHGHYGPGAGSKQGIYVCTPAGGFLASINSNRPEAVVATLEAGLKKWRALPAEVRSKPPKGTAPQSRFEWMWPKGGTGLTVTMRYLPEVDDPTVERHRDYNHDSLWFSADEARQFLPAKPVKGSRHQLPAPLFERIARLNLVDAVRGETRANRQVQGAIETAVTEVDGDLVTLRIAGNSDARGTPQRRGLYAPLGIKAQILGSARYDLKRRRFVSFELVGKGLRWAQPRRSRRSGRRASRRRDPTRNLGWYFTLTPTRDDGFYVAPTHIRRYEADWVRRSGR